MQINNLSSNQSFRGAGSVFKGFATALDTTAQATTDIADLVSTASLAMDTPDVATVKILNDKLNTVSKNEKVPKAVRNGIKYTCCAIATGLTFFITRNCLRGKGVIVDLISKSKIGQSMLNFKNTMKANIAKIKIPEKLHLKGKFDFVKTYADKTVTYIKGVASSAGNTLETILNKVPKVKNGINKVVDFINIKNWTKRDYFANITATLLAGKHAAKALKTPNEATKPTTEIANIQLPEQKTETAETKQDKPEIIEPDVVDEGRDAA